MNFRDMVAADLHNVFLDDNAFAEKRTVEYDGDRYEDIPLTLSGPKEEDRQQPAGDHAQKLYRVSAVLHCARADLGGKQPEQGQRFRIRDETDSGFFKEYSVVSSVCRMGMLRVVLGAIDE